MAATFLPNDTTTDSEVVLVGSPEILEASSDFAVTVGSELLELEGSSITPYWDDANNQ